MNLLLANEILIILSASLSKSRQTHIQPPQQFMSLVFEKKYTKWLITKSKL